MSVRAKSRLMGSGTSLAVRHAYETAIRVFLEGLSDDTADYADALEIFFRNQTVCAELSVLLEPDSLAKPDVSNLRSVLTTTGLDLSTMPWFSMDAAVQRMTDAFVSAAAQNDVLRSILQYRLSVETRLIVEEIHRQTASLSLDELRSVLELAGYQLLAFEIDERGDALVRFQRPGGHTIVISGSVQFRASLLALILNRIDIDEDAG